VNYTMDGITAMDNLHNSGVLLYTNVASVDRVAEFRVVTSPADAGIRARRGTGADGDRGGSKPVRWQRVGRVTQWCPEREQLVQQRGGKRCEG